MQIKLTRKQVDQLAEIMEQFTEVQDFTIESTCPSGIGPTVTVSFDLFKPKDTIVDITDVSNW